MLGGIRTQKQEGPDMAEPGGGEREVNTAETQEVNPGRLPGGGCL